MGALEVPADHYWGAQTQRSLHFFDVGRDTMPGSIVHSFGILKRAAAEVNADLGLLASPTRDLIVKAADEVATGALDLSSRPRRQTGSARSRT
jgi:fumarate hydratase class II